MRIIAKLPPQELKLVTEWLTDSRLAHYLYVRGLSWNCAAVTHAYQLSNWRDDTVIVMEDNAYEQVELLIYEVYCEQTNDYTLVFITENPLESVMDRQGGSTGRLPFMGRLLASDSQGYGISD